MFEQSRYRKAQVMDAVGVGLLLLFSTAVGAAAYFLAGGR